jgi:hypothetical protein
MVLDEEPELNPILLTTRGNLLDFDMEAIAGRERRKEENLTWDSDCVLSVAAICAPSFSFMPETTS